MGGLYSAIKTVFIQSKQNDIQYGSQYLNDRKLKISVTMLKVCTVQLKKRLRWLKNINEKVQAEFIVQPKKI